MLEAEFLVGIDKYNPGVPHRPMLWVALERTKGPVYEFGCGTGSTPFLRRYCQDSNRYFMSYDSCKEWAVQHGAIHVFNWDCIDLKKIDVLLIDHAPGDRRHVDVLRWLDFARFIVIHDSEPTATGYMMDRVWPKVRHKVDIRSSGAWVSMVSQTDDMANLIGKQFGSFVITR